VGDRGSERREGKKRERRKGGTAAADGSLIASKRNGSWLSRRAPALNDERKERERGKEKRGIKRSGGNREVKQWKRRRIQREKKQGRSLDSIYLLFFSSDQHINSSPEQQFKKNSRH